jgi:hypothetical protein
VKLLAQEFMLSINRQEPSDGEDMTIAVFWEQRYLTYCEEVIVGGRPRKKPSTVRGYRQIWAQHLKAHFGTLTLRQYQARQIGRGQGWNFTDREDCSFSQQCFC